MCRECICPETEDEEDQMDGKCTVKQDMLGVEAREDEVFEVYGEHIMANPGEKNRNRKRRR